MSLSKVIKAFKIGRKATKTNIEAVIKLESKIENMYKYLDDVSALNRKINQYKNCEEIINSNGTIYAKLAFYTGRISKPLDYVRSELYLNAKQKEYSD
ncbi:MAG: hypothetical protein WC758_01605 [Candidatus Woesearchaeota archaeon]|jgi:hypothetical protein